MAAANTRRARRDAERTRRSGRQAVIGGVVTLVLGTAGLGYVLTGPDIHNAVAPLPPECSTTQRVSVVTDAVMARVLETMPVNPASCIVVDPVTNGAETVSSDHGPQGVSAGLWIPATSAVHRHDDTTSRFTRHTDSLASTPAVVVAGGNGTDFPTWTGVLADPSVTMGDPGDSASAHGALRSVVAEMDHHEASRTQVRKAVVSRASQEAASPRTVELSDEQLLERAREHSSSVVVTEQSFLDFVATHDVPDTLRAHVPDTGATMLDYPLMVPSEAGRHNRTISRAAEEITRFVGSEPGRRALRAQHLRPAGGERVADPRSVDVGRQLDAGDPADRAAVMSTWNRKSSPQNALLLVDRSSSMARRPESSRSTSALRTALDSTVSQTQALPASDVVGLWTTATAHGRSPAERRVPLRPLDQETDGRTQREVVRTELEHVTAAPGASSGLYDATLAAVREVRKNHRDGATDVVYVITDDATDRGSSLSLDRLLETLRREQSRQPPVLVVTISVTSGDVPADLRRISEATGGTSHTAATLDGLRRAHQDALVTF